MKKLMIPLFLITGLLIACNSSDSAAQKMQQEEEAAWKEMMKVHDEVMPKMADMNRVARTLRPYLEEGKLEDKRQQEAVNRAIRQLETADDAMMDWMAEVKQLKALREEMEHEAIMEYLQQEQNAIAKVRDDMLNSLENGQELLQKLETNDE
jgi:hypothetical protein